MKLLNRITTFAVFWVGISVVPSYAQQLVQTAESIAFGGHLSPLVKVQKDGRDYLYHLDGDVWIDEVENRAADLFVVIKDGYYGVLKEDGNLIIPFEYDRIQLMTEYTGQWYEGIPYDYKFVILTKDGKTGVGNENGEIVLPLLYDDAKPINQNIIAFCHNKLWGWASVTNEQVLQQPEYDYVRDFSDDYLMIEKEGLTGVVNAEASFIVPCQYRYVRLIKTPQTSYFYGVNSEEADLYNLNGQLLLKTEGIDAMGNSEYLKFEENSLYGIFDPVKTEVVVPPTFERIENVIRGLSIAKKDGSFGVIRQDGTIVLDFLYDEVNFINSRGQVRSTDVITLSYSPMEDSAYYSEEALSKRAYEHEVEKAPYLIKAIKDQSPGMYDWKGENLIPVGKHTFLSPIYHNDQVYFKVGTGEKFGLIDGNGKELLTEEYLFSESYRYATKAINTQHGLLNRFILLSKGHEEGSLYEQIGLYDLERKKIILEPAAQHIEFLSERYIKIMQFLPDYKKKVKWYDLWHGQLFVFPEEVDDFYIVSDSHLLVDRAGMYQLTDWEGRLAYENKDWKIRGTFLPIRFPEYKNHPRGDFYHGLMKIYAEERNLFVDGSGKEIRFEDFDYVDDFYEGFAVAAKKVGDDENRSGFKYKRGLINIAGEIIVPFEYHDVYASGKDNEALLFSNEHIKKMIRRDGTVVLNAEYSYIESGSNYDNTIVAKNNKYGLVGSQGNLLVQPLYDELRRNANGEDRTWPLRVRQGEWYYFISKDGEKYPIRAKQTHY